jgi:hypothetical protein
LATSSWESEPLYLLDEFSSYCNGTQAAIEQQVDAHGSDEFMLTMADYADGLVAAVRANDPQYPDLPKLVQFVEWEKARAKRLANEYRGRK